MIEMTDCENCKKLREEIRLLEEARALKFVIPESWFEEEV
jgi:hypothetical protein